MSEIYFKIVLYKRPIPLMYIYSETLLYTKSNLHGNLLVDICKTYQLRILNGRFLCDSLGYYSFFSSNGKSTIIILVSTELFYDIMYFNILTPSELSDHCLINAAIKTRSIEREISPEMNYLPGKCIWSDEKREIYINSLLDEEPISNIIKLEELLDDQTNRDINDMVNTMSNIYKDAAKKTLAFKRFIQRKTEESKNPKIIDVR